MENEVGDSLEFNMLKIEYEKLELEKKRIESEARMRKWTVITVLIPILLGLVTLWYDIWNQNQQAKREFSLKAAGIIANSNNTFEAKGKLKALQALFPGFLSDSIDAFDPTVFSGGPSYENKLNFLKLMTDSGKDRNVMMEMYEKVFPGSEIVEAVKQDANHANSAQPGAAGDAPKAGHP